MKYTGYSLKVSVFYPQEFEKILVRIVQLEVKGHMHATATEKHS